MLLVAHEDLTHDGLAECANSKIHAVVQPLLVFNT